ncbi:MAG: SDR family NAD(P)-dependent oxidoreductase [Pseudomonadota bacterium]
MDSFYKDKSILITGGTGTFGQECAKVLQTMGPRRIAILSRGEDKQYEMQKRWPDTHEEKSIMRYFIGDVRDKSKLSLAFKGMDLVIHAAAMKQIPICEYNPSEAVKTNVLGAQNIIEVAVERKIERVIALSSDKAVDPINLYGATKLTAEKLFVAANTLGPKFSVVRYGNVLGSRGSVLPIFLKQKEEGYFRVTDSRMTRFWITITDAVKFVLNHAEEMEGGEIFVPKMSSSPVLSLALATSDETKGYRIDYTGIRPGEKLHEVLVSPSEVERAFDMGDFFMILPGLKFFDGDRFKPSGVTIGQSYTSQTNEWQVTAGELRKMIRKLI